jgi:N-acetyl-anhydromuramyl-L-alanine amidase AmpD
MKPSSVLALLLLAACQGPVPAEDLNAGRSIVLCGQRFPIGTRVVLWTEPPYYDAYKPHPVFSDEGPQGLRYQPGRAETLEQARAAIDQFVLHYDGLGTSELCFRVLQDRRKLSVQFLLDVDGTIYQTLDARERAWHATKSNRRSVGVEMAQLGAFPADEAPPGASVVGRVQGQVLHQAPFTDAQLDALVKLAAGLCRALPRIHPDAPRDASGRIRDSALGDEEFEAFSGILGHFHVQTNKTDPGPAFPWEDFLDALRRDLARG